ncbi:MAG: PLDc_N domain-containing protein [Oscillochloris sp.]|nr:PLDc_N domain-containing protein [Oscillochloris sp.]
MPKQRKTWGDLSTPQKALTIVGVLIQLALLVAAQRDLWRRSAEEINGPRWVWTLICLVNVIGPISYFMFGRKHQG